ncbi:hypothetical protein AWB95_10300 [Mycobacterium celatum]|uniref:Uncharacterized protein n=1 Tax=Mycobacterium celatum TaxID=28045 RepID=A0A1X1RRM5_MYCCE|nr:hypothetical protein AWB95_10300 [Mycobacterium celatum]PIB80240.1 hypothetical protein CQY23_04260 [Mycobacterium celatum]
MIASTWMPLAVSGSILRSRPALARTSAIQVDHARSTVSAGRRASYIVDMACRAASVRRNVFRPSVSTGDTHARG